MMHINEAKSYRGYTILDFPLGRVGDYEQHLFKVTDADKVEFSAVVKCSRTNTRIKYLTNGETLNLEQIGLHFVKGTIDSSLYSTGEEIEYWVPLATDSSDDFEIDDATIRNELLKWIIDRKRKIIIFDY